MVPERNRKYICVLVSWHMHDTHASRISVDVHRQEVLLGERGRTLIAGFATNEDHAIIRACHLDTLREELFFALNAARAGCVAAAHAVHRASVKLHAAEPSRLRRC